MVYYVFKVKTYIWAFFGFVPHLLYKHVSTSLVLISVIGARPFLGTPVVTY